MPGARGRYFDGQSAMRHRVDVVFDRHANELVISGDTLADAQRWPVPRLRALADEAHGYRLTLAIHVDGNDETQRNLARLSVSEPGLIRELRQSCPQLNRRDLRRGSRRRLLQRTVLAAAAMALILFVILPRMAETLARLIPVEQEIALGKSVVTQIELALGGTKLGGLRCSGRQGQAALDRLVARLTQAQELKYQVSVLVFDHGMINAFAAPGGQIVVLRGLLDEANGPEELAGVLAHEIGHAERRDPTRHALRTAGSAGIVSLILGDFSGGTLAVFLGEWLLNAGYTREAEAEADRFALDLLNAAGIDSDGTAAFFEMIEALDAPAVNLPKYFSTHPAAGDRAARARKNSETQRGTAPTLSDSEWQALKSICHA